mmetsp:Transcript_13593/g.38637  ORF Transcript_13593/g.38637 Transcript_13593/m.38637 type:complete len:208 (-) Transcript_13593:216-839(-)
MSTSADAGHRITNGAAKHKTVRRCGVASHRPPLWWPAPPGRGPGGPTRASSAAHTGAMLMACSARKRPGGPMKGFFGCSNALAGGSRQAGFDPLCWICCSRRSTCWLSSLIWSLISATFISVDLLAVPAGPAPMPGPAVAQLGAAASFGRSVWAAASSHCILSRYSCIIDSSACLSAWFDSWLCCGLPWGWMYMGSSRNVGSCCNCC